MSYKNAPEKENFGLWAVVFQFVGGRNLWMLKTPFNCATQVQESFYP